jgi:hypothetical protein
MTFLTVAILATLAVKNGPPGMWRSLGTPSTVEPIGRFVSSPLWLAATTCVFLALTAVVFRRVRRGAAAPGRALVLTTAILGLLVVAEWLTRNAIVSLLTLTVLAAAWTGVLLNARRQRDHAYARHPDKRGAHAGRSGAGAGHAGRADARRSDAGGKDHDERSGTQRTGEGRPTEVVDLAHWRESKQARRRAGSR